MIYYQFVLKRLFTNVCKNAQIVVQNHVIKKRQLGMVLEDINAMIVTNGFLKRRPERLENSF